MFLVGTHRDASEPPKQQRGNRRTIRTWTISPRAIMRTAQTPLQEPMRRTARGGRITMRPYRTHQQRARNHVPRCVRRLTRTGASAGRMHCVGGWVQVADPDDCRGRCQMVNAAGVSCRDASRCVRTAKTTTGQPSHHSHLDHLAARHHVNGTAPVPCTNAPDGARRTHHYADFATRDAGREDLGYGI